MKILGIETSGQQFSLCLNEGEKMLCEIRKDRVLCEDTRDAHLFVEVKRILDYLGKEKIGAIAVSIGPGMFTSLRVGLSLAKGLSRSWNIPLFAINTLDAIGMTAPFIAPGPGLAPEPCPGPTNDGYFQTMLVVPVINAHRNEIYAAVYIAGRRVSDYLLSTPAEIGATVKQYCSRGLEQPLLAYIGPGAGLLKDIIKQGMTNGISCFISSADHFLPSGSKIIALALPRIRDSDIDDPAALVPFYLKKTDAERNIKS